MRAYRARIRATRERRSARAATLAMLTGESEPAGAAPVPARSVAARPKSSLRGRYNTAIDFETVHSLLAQGVVNPRPPYLCSRASTDNETFLEQPLLARKRGWDRWITSGGRKGGTETWLSDTDGVLKRYVRVVATDPAQPALKGAQYTLLKRTGPGAETVEDKTKHCWIVNRNTHHQHPVPQMAQVQTMELRAGPGQSFVSFQSSAPGEEGLELGAVGKHWQTVSTFRSMDPSSCAVSASTPAAAVLCTKRSLRCRLCIQCATELESNSRVRRGTLQSGISVYLGNHPSMRVMW